MTYSFFCSLATTTSHWNKPLRIYVNAQCHASLTKGSNHWIFCQPDQIDPAASHCLPSHSTKDGRAMVQFYWPGQVGIKSSDYHHLGTGTKSYQKNKLKRDDATVPMGSLNCIGTPLSGCMTDCTSAHPAEMQSNSLLCTRPQ